jgi:hypothetical protein
LAEFTSWKKDKAALSDADARSTKATAMMRVYKEGYSMNPCADRHHTPIWILVALAAVSAPVSTAKAAGSIAWVSSAGLNSRSCGAITSPCQTLQHAHDVAVLANGVIAIRDSGVFGPVTITKAVSIVNDGAGTAMIANTAAGGTAVTVKAGGGDKVVLRGLSIHGGGTGQTGVAFISGASLSIEKCGVRNFAVAGIALGPTAPATVTVSDTVTENNGSHGVYLQPRTQATGFFHASFFRVQSNNNSQNGFGIYGNLAPNASVRATIVDAASVYNRGNGYYALGSNHHNVVVTLVRSTGQGNGLGSTSSTLVAILADDGATIQSSESNIGNDIRPHWGYRGNGGILSYSDNLTSNLGTTVSHILKD